MHNIIIDEQFKALLPALNKEDFASLKESILENGCLFPLVVWGDILIDGYNRYSICIEYDVPFETISKEFNSRDDVLIWIIEFQIARRNLTPLLLSYYRGLHYKADKRLVTNPEGSNQYSAEVGGQNDPQPRSASTAVRLGENYDVSPKTIKRDSQVATAIDVLGEASPEAKRNVLSGVTKITKKQLKELLSGTDDEIMELAAKIEDGSFERRKPRTQVSDTDSDQAENVKATPLPLEVEVKRMTDAFFSELRTTSGSATAAQQKAALQSHISNLEHLLLKLWA